MKCYQLNFDENAILSEEMKSLLNTLCGIQNDGDLLNTGFTIGIISDSGKLKFYCLVDDDFESVLKQKLNTVYPELEFNPYDISIIENKLKTNSKFCKMRLKYDNSKKLQTQNQEKTFMNNILNSIYTKDKNYTSIVEISLKPIPTYSKKIKNTINKSEIKEKIKDNINKENINKAAIKGTKFVAKTSLKCIGFLLDSILSTDTKPSYSSYEKYKQTAKEEDKALDFNYSVSIKIAVHGKESSENELTIRLKNISGVFSQLNFTNMFMITPTDHSDMFTRNRHGMLLTTNEINQFLYLPPKQILDNVVGSSGTKILIDRNVPEEGIVIGLTLEEKNIAIPTPPIILTSSRYSEIYKQYSKQIEDIVKPRLAMGLPGTGKSEWIVNYAINCLKRGLPFILMDPKYDTQKRLIESLTVEQLATVDFLDLGDLVYPPALNIFRRRKDNDPTENGLITSSFVSYMKKQFDRSWGYNLERMIQMTTDAILLDDVSTLTEFYWMLNEEVYRTTIIEILKSKIQDPNTENKSRLKQLLKYWVDYQEKYKKNPLTISKEIEPVMNKIGVFIGNRFINAIVSQRQSYDFRKTGDKARSVIINVPEGIINPQNMALLCGFVNKAIWMDYQSRDDIELCDRYPVQWIIDEAHTVIDDEFVGILQKGRSRRLGITLITQTLASLDMKGVNMSSIISDNCKSKMIFKIGYMDARNLCDEFNPLVAKDLSECPDYHFYSKVLLPDGTVSKPFFVYPLPIAPKLRNYDEYKNTHRSGRLKIGQIEDEIDNRLESFSVAAELMK